MVKSLPANAGDFSSVLGWEDTLKKEMATHSSILAGKSQGQRSLADYSPWCLRVGHSLATKQHNYYSVVKLVHTTDFKMHAVCSVPCYH